MICHPLEVLLIHFGTRCGVQLSLGAVERCHRDEAGQLLHQGSEEAVRGDGTSHELRIDDTGMQREAADVVVGEPSLEGAAVENIALRTTE